MVDPGGRVCCGSCSSECCGGPRDGAHDGAPGSGGLGRAAGRDGVGCLGPGRSALISVTDGRCARTQGGREDDRISPAWAEGSRHGVAELLTGDDGTVAWADLQYVVFTLITLVYFAVQFLARPTGGLPPVPAALLTLMSVSVTGYAANKVVNTRGVKPKSQQ